MQTINARKIALTILEEMDDRGSFSTLSLNKKLNFEKASYADRRFVSQLVYGVLENKLLLDHVIQSYSNTKLSKMNHFILNDLRMGAYQIMFLDRIPHSAAVNEAVKLVKKKYPGLDRFVNGVLRTISRNPKDFKLPDKEREPLKYLSVLYSHPEWLVDRWIQRFGIEFTELLLKGNNTSPELTIRVNGLKMTGAELVETLGNKGVKLEPGRVCGACYKVKESDRSPMELDAFERGLFTVQDEASAKAAEVLNPQPGDLVLDVCAAPGGKTLYMADLMKNEGQIIARDIYPHKLKLIDDNAKRLGIKNLKLQNRDALQLHEDSVGMFDKVLVDAPCSGLGIIRRKPEIRYNKTAADIENLAEMQLKMLEISAQYLKKGGELVYSTCTIEPEENEQIVEAFMKTHDDFEYVDIRSKFESECVQSTPYVTLYPQISETDGFFICKFRRK